MGKGFNLAKIVAVGLAFWAALVATAQSQVVDSTVPKSNANRTQSSGNPYRDAGDSSLQNPVFSSGQMKLSDDPISRDQVSPTRVRFSDGNEDYVAPRTPWYLRAEGGAMLMASSQNVEFQSNGGGASVLSTSGMANQFSGAGNFLIGRTFTNLLQFEAQFTGVMTASNSADVWDNTANKYYQDPAKLIHVPGNMFSPFSNFGGGSGSGVAGLDYNKFAEISNTSAFHSVELNFRRRVLAPPELVNMSILAGLRYAGMPEEFNYFTLSDVTAQGQYVHNGSVNEINISTINEMIGPQVGTLVEFYAENRWWMDFEIKVGLMSNHSRETSYYRNINNGTATTYESSDSGNSMSVLTDLNFTCVYRWSPHFTTRLGYKAVWITNVASAQDNFSNDINLYQYEQTSNLDAKSSALLHGPFIGFDFNW
jgi:hypothetical protein